MNCDSNEVIDFRVIQKGQYSEELEKQGCEIMLGILTSEENLNIGTFVTDRHTAIGAMMREKFSTIFHAFDIWHMAKSLLKKLVKRGKKHPKIALWSKSIVRHFWWSAKQCKSNPQLLVEMFHSFLIHCLNIHNWKRRVKIFNQLKELKGKRQYPQKPSFMSQCYHTRLSNLKSRECIWFKVEDDDYKAIFKIISDARFSNTIKKRCKFVHTGKLESFHSLKL